jgi:hypothetical protein
MSFVANLPLEIVHHIFSLSIDFSKLQAWTPEFKNRKLSDYPVVLTSVCHMWSRAVLSCPQLWSTLPIVIYRAAEGPHYHVDVELELEGIEYFPPLIEIARWISRSGSTPLTISVRPGIGEDELDDAWFNECYGIRIKSLLDTVLLPHHHRWAKVSLRIPTPFEASQDALSGLLQPTAYPALKEFLFHGLNSDKDEGPAQALIHVLSHSPRLVSIGLHEVDVPRFSMDLQAAIPWNGLSSIFLNKDVGKRYSAQGILHLLRDDGVPNLERLGISMHETGEDPGTLHIQHEKLRELDLRESCPTQFLVFIAHVTLPNLSILTMPADCLEERHSDDCGTKAMPRFATIVPTFIERSRCRLENVRLHEDFIFPVPGYQVLPILRAVRGSVEHLQIILAPSEVETALEWLTVRRGAASVDEGESPVDDVAPGAAFPQLKHLVLKLWASEDTSPGKYSQPLLEMIESRWNVSKESGQTPYIDIGLRTKCPEADKEELKKRALALMGTGDMSRTVDRLRGLVEGPKGGIAFGEVDHNRRIQITIGGYAGESHSGIYKRYFDTWLPRGVWTKPPSTGPV